MSEWWTYSLSDFLLFSERTYFRLFALYNRDVWPLQWLALAIGIAVLGGLLRGGVRCRLLAMLLLSACWWWVAWAYHFERYATINWAAPTLGWAFAIEGALLAWYAMAGSRRLPDPADTTSRRIGAVLMSFALVAYPLLAPAAGRPWEQAEVFGIAPDPTVAATLGALLAVSQRPSWLLWLLWPIPLLWCAISGATLWTMGARFALLLPAIALAAALGLCNGLRCRKPPFRSAD